MKITKNSSSFAYHRRPLSHEWLHGLSGGDARWLHRVELGSDGVVLHPSCLQGNSSAIPTRREYAHVRQLCLVVEL